MLDFFAKLFAMSDFTTRAERGPWSPESFWLLLGFDLAIGGAFIALAFIVLFFVAKRRESPFRNIFLLFAAFLLSSGLAHGVEALDVWLPVGRFAAVLKLVTALASWATVIALFKILPKALELPGVMKLNAQLKQEIAERKSIEQERESLLAREQTARAEAERASRLKDDFLSTVSHEIRTPLNAILGWAQILRGPNVTQADLEQGLEVIERNSRAQTRLVNDLLDMSRIVSGKVKLEVQPVDLVATLRAALNSARPAAEAKEIAIEESLDPLAAGFVGDPNRLQQIVWNLLSNAIKFTPKGGLVRLTLERRESEVAIAVTDTGVGISPEFLPYVFDRFSQADGGTTRRFSGLGLGLAIVKQLSELHGGTVRVASRGAGTGATFTVLLPIKAIRAREEPTSERPHWHGGDVPRLDGATILVVDDEPDSRQLVKKVLRGAGAEVEVAASADEAFNLFQENALDLIVSDIGMPEKDGYEFIREVRSTAGRQVAQIPAIALTAFARSEDRLKALLAGYQAHVVKPAEPEELITLAASLLGRLR
jgi:signal transduction histidine kinase